MLAVAIFALLVQSIHSSTVFNCNFNFNDCGLVQRSDDDFDWTKHFGMTDTDNTGPWTDTDGWGDYMYTDARNKPAGSKAKLETPAFSFSGGGKCLSFNYHMHGYTMGKLAVYVGSQLMWTRAGDQGDLWRHASLALPVSSGTHKIVFEGTIGNGALSDMAIDDIVVEDCSVPATPGPTPPQPPPPTATPSQPAGTTLPPPPPTQATQAPPTPSGSCGIRPSSRIVGGTDASHGDWPWQALLRYASTGSQFCGGALVHPQWVVTASHCLANQVASQVLVRMGAHKRTYTVGTEQDFKVSKIIMHSSYQTPKSYSHDIALVKLDRPAMLDKYTNLVCLPETIPEVPAGTTCWITGWGTLSSGGSQPETLQQASVPIVHQDVCKSSYANEIDDTMICAGLQQGGIDACQGDSGGPMVCETGGRFYLHGATSWGYGCAAPDKYGVYARVKYLHSWIKTQMNNN